ncbi:MAG: D-glycero-beta-D-manno-heptose 1-phosphate adenylyltransferase [Fusobacteriaceae bacterium]|jgi:glycerol-3-phosphate cytidylyltransferase|nr:D-glycero-beta-D-manno-heptose 1-phosphate adenylyltransferase [Fusobacteriaceae bacterium]
MILTRAEAAATVARLKARGKVTVFTNGVFDILHTGHLRYLTEARKQGDYLIVGLNSDESVKKIKGPARPVNGEADRAELLDGLKPVCDVVIFSEETPTALLDELKPAVHVKGGDYTKDALPETAVVEKNGGEVRILSFVPGKSTTATIAAIQEAGRAEGEK